MNECVEENSDRDASPEKLDESCSSEQLEEANLDELCDVNNTPNHCDEVKCVPGVFEIVLKEKNMTSTIGQVEVDKCETPKKRVYFGDHLGEPNLIMENVINQ